MTKDQFETEYVQKSHMSIDELDELGGHAEICQCGEENCKGCQMMFEKKKDN